MIFFFKIPKILKLKKLLGNLKIINFQNQVIKDKFLKLNKKWVVAEVVVQGTGTGTTLEDTIMGAEGIEEEEEGEEAMLYSFLFLKLTNGISSLSK